MTDAKRWQLYRIACILIAGLSILFTYYLNKELKPLDFLTPGWIAVAPWIFMPSKHPQSRTAKIIFHAILFLFMVIYEIVLFKIPRDFWSLPLWIILAITLGFQVYAVIIIVRTLKSTN